MAGPYKSLDDLDAAMSAKEQAKPYQSIGDLDAAISQSDANDQQRLGFSAKQSLTSNPEQYIKARDLGSQFGIPPDVAERNLPEVEYRNKLNALIGTMQKSPALGGLMQDPGYLKRTHDDIDALAQIEMQTKGFRAASEFQRKALDAEMQGIFDRSMTGAKIEAEIERNRPRTVLDYVGQGGSALASSLWSANSGLWGLGRAAADVAGTVLPDETAKELSGFFTRYQQATGKTAQEMLGDPNQQGFVERSVYSGLQSLGQNLLTLPAALIPGVGAGVALGPMTAMTGGTEYGKARDKGVAIPQALIYGASQMAIEYATEVMPVTKFLGDIKAGTPFASMLMKQVAYEVPGEQVATLLQDLNEWAVINPAKPFAAYLEERPSAAAQTLIATIVGVGGQATTVKGVEALVGAFTGQEQAFADPMLRKANASQRSLDAEAKLTQLVDAAGQSMSIARDPSAVQELVDAADEDGQTELYINARQFANVFNQSPVETAAALGVTPEALNDALASNTDIVVPLSTFTVAVARDHALRPIIEHTRVDPGDMSPVEARLWQSQQGDQFKAEAEAVLAKRQADETFKAEVQQVHDNLLGQLNQAGRWAPQVNQKYAAMVRDFYVTMADRAGMTVSEMAAKYPLRVVAEGQGALQQGQGGFDRVVDLFGNGSRVQYFNDRKGVFVESQQYPNGKTKWRAGDVVDGLDSWLSDKEFASREEAEAAIRGLRVSNTLKAKNASKYGGIPNLWKGEEKKVAKALIDAGFAIDRFSTSTQSRSKYLYLENGVKVRLADHTLPNSYDAPDVDFRYGGDIAALVEEVRAVPPAPTLQQSPLENTPGFKQGEGTPRASFDPSTNTIALLEGADLSSFLHESAHFFLEVMADLASRPDAPASIRKDFETALAWMGVPFDPIGGRSGAAGDMGGTLEQPAYHGSPYKFDKFSLEHLGKGEGAQAYGWGLYFAGKKSVAEHYRRALAPTNPDALQMHALAAGLEPEMADTMAQFYAAKRTSTFADFAKQIEEKSPSEYIEKFRDKYIRPAIADGSAKAAWDSFREAGQLYEVDIPEEGSYLLWDKPLSEQPEAVKAALASGGYSEGKLLNWKTSFGADVSGTFEQLSGEGFYGALENLNGSAEAASKYLNSLGIAGIKYLDGTSRDKGEGSFNYVIFDDSAVKVLQTYYQGGPETDPGAPTSPLGRTAAETWSMMSLDEKRPYHEKWARGFEAYLFEGRAPSVEMQGIFQRFSQWLKQVYTSLNALNVELTDDVRGVFDRMIASEDAIKTAEAVRNFAPIFQTAEQAGMTAEEWEQYQAEGRESTDTAVDELQARSIRDMRWQANAKAKKIKELQATAKELRAEVKIDVRREVLSQPLYRAWQFLTGKEVSQSALEYREAVNNYARQLAGWEKSREQKVKDVTTRAKQDVWEASEEGQVRYRKAESRVKAQAKVERRDAVQIQKRADEYMGQWESENPRPVEPTQSGKKTPEPKSDPNKVDPTKDTLLIAIAKLGGLDKLQAVEEWGLDPKEKIPQVAFGKPVVRKEGGRKLDAMAEALAQYGYLETDATGKWDNRQFEEMFFDALRGGEYFSQYGKEAMIAAATRDAQGDPDAGITLENTPAGKMNTEMLKGMYGETDTAPWRLLSALRMTSPDGIAPDQVADLFGFTSGDDLVRRLAVAEDPKALIDQLTDQRMLELHGDLATPAEIELAAERAIHNDVRARVLTRELNALRKATGQGNVMLKAARMHADQWLARQTVKNATRHAQHVAAEGRAARASAEALKAGDTAAAAVHKRDQLLNNQLARGSIRAGEEVRRAVKYLKKFDKAGSRKAIDQDYLDQIDQLLERFDLRQVSGKALEKRASLAAWLKQQEEMGLDPVIDAALVEEAQRQHYSTLTLEEFRGLVDSIQSIEHMGRLKNRLLTAKDKREFKAVKDELVANIIANANRSVTTTNPITPLEKGAKILRNFSAMHRKFASIIREMDGGQDGGKMWEYLVRTMNDAGDAEVEMRSAMSEKFADLFAGLKGIKLNEKVYIPALKISLRREELLAVALNSGNEGNVQRLLDGGINESLRAITYRQLFDVLNMVTPQEWDFVEGVWGMIEANRPAIAAQEKALTGVEPKWVEPTPFTLASGRVIRGGYYPAKYNADMSTRSNELEAVTDLRQQMMGAGGRAATRKSYTEARAAEVSGRPMRLDLGVIAQHINEVTHRLAWQEWLIDARRILHAPDIDRAIRDHYGPEILAQLKKQLVDIAAGDNGPTDAMDRVMAHLRNGTTIAGMGWNIMTSLMQPIGLTQSAERIGVQWLAKGLAEYMRGNPFKVTADVHERSSFMANRAKTLNREINDVLNQIKSERMSQVEASYFYLIQKFQQMVDIPTWLGAYEKAIAEGNTDDRAIALADQAVIDSQGAGQLKDLAAIQRGSAGQKLFTAFYSFFSTTYQRAVENYRATDFRNPLQVGKLAANYLLLFTLPAVWGWALKEALRGDDDDEDAAKIAKRLAAEQLNYLLGTMVLVREIGGAISGFQGYQGPAGTRFFAGLGKFIKQAQQGDVDMALVKAAANTVGVAAHLPSGQVIKSVEGTVAVMDGKAGPQAILVGPPLKN